ncbi:hypothetical protein [Thermoflexus sp.]|uniref:hypothetical protein n=1 Tax=Thermoflexus sp. TaxID=1969742 RepID=UPI00185BCB9B|nr:hypothetical protein [Thermoflexus sp.]
MKGQWFSVLRRWRGGALLAGLLLLLGILTPSGEVTVRIGPDREGPWPQFRVIPSAPRPGDPVIVEVQDRVPWGHILLTVNGEPAALERIEARPELMLWRWVWRFPMPAGSVTVAFYRDCHEGCRLRGRLALGDPEPTPAPLAIPTKLGLVFPHPERDWKGRAGWAVELTYAQRAEDPDWGINALAARVARHQRRGLRVLVRVDYDRGQTLPPPGDLEGLARYLRYLERLGRDERLQGVYAYFLGSGPNEALSNRMSPDRPISPAWYARVFNGYGESPVRTDNAAAVLRAANPRARLLVGPVRPYVRDQDGERRGRVDVPWLNYFNTLVAFIDETTRARAAMGQWNPGPDGFALHVPGRPEAARAAGYPEAEEPRLDLRDAMGARVGFQALYDWLEIINAYPSTRGRPVYITSSNTYTPDEGVPPAHNYPRGWLTAAWSVVAGEPQVEAFCWFLDWDPQWADFSLWWGKGRLRDAAAEFEALLTTGP